MYLFCILLVSSANAQTTLDNILELNDQAIYYISKNNVRVRSAPDTKSKILGYLSLNDRVKIINPTIVSKSNMVEIVIVETYDPIEKSDKRYVSLDFLSVKIIDYKEFVGEYYIVINVATETLRLYKRICPDNSCPNKMIMETEVVVGEDIDHPKEEKGKGRSILGSYRITGWSKFYQDGAGHYPAWYREGYPEMPKAGASWNKWMSQKIMPISEDGKRVGVMRGAFGWFTAFVAPEPFAQWLHGTLGWGSDKDKYITRVKKNLINIVSDPRSSGCTRNNNEAIAYLRSMIDMGTPIIKIYAKEEILDSTLSNYPIQSEEWNYILTKNRSHAVKREDVLKNLGVTFQDVETFLEAKKSGGEIILDPTNTLNQVLEAGTYALDVHPDVISYTPGEKLGKLGRAVGRKGNVYGIKEKNMHGIFYIDAGVLASYAHPETVLELSGFLDEVTPPWMESSNLLKF
jgi:hypothetical protein